MSGVKKWTKKLNRSEAHDYEYPEHQDLISMVEALYMESDTQVFALLHQIANLALRGEMK